MQTKLLAFNKAFLQLLLAIAHANDIPGNLLYEYSSVDTAVSYNIAQNGFFGRNTPDVTDYDGSFAHMFDNDMESSYFNM